MNIDPSDPIDAISLISGIDYNERQSAKKDPIVEKALEAIAGNVALSDLEFRESKLLESKLEFLCKGRDSRVTDLARTVLVKDSAEHVDSEVRRHPSFNPEPLNYAIELICEGRKSTLSELLREYCEINLKEGEFLLRSSSEPHGMYRGNYTELYVYSKKQNGRVEHTLIKRSEDFKKNVRWKVNKNESATFDEALKDCSLGSFPKEMAEHPAYNAKEGMRIVDKGAPEVGKKSTDYHFIVYNKGIEFELTCKDVKDGNSLWFTSDGRIGKSLADVLKS